MRHLRIACVCVVAAALAGPAWASGALFGVAYPIEQHRAEVLLRVEDGTVDMTTRVVHSWLGKSLGWVLPLPAAPELVTTSVEDLFHVLRLSTEPCWDARLIDHECPHVSSPNSCCYAHGGVGCKDPQCVADICMPDPYCCTTKWDSICADAAFESCKNCGGGGVPWYCCDATQLWGCYDQGCSSQICGLDDTCCEVSWDSYCAAAAVKLCDVCEPPAIDCCDPLWAYGCLDSACEASVCLTDPTCCDAAWDWSCASLAEDACCRCGGSAPVPPDVIGSGQAGPYEYAVLESDDAAGLVSWLEESGYDQPSGVQALAEHYIEKGYVFLAVKMQQEHATSRLAPLRVRFPAPGGTVPLALTSLGASGWTPVTVWVLGQARAVPQNWLHVRVNPKRLAWHYVLSWGVGYAWALHDAIGEATGRAFSTEYAGTAAVAWGRLFDPSELELGPLLAAGDAEEWIAAASDLFAWPPVELFDVLDVHVPLPEDLADQGVTPTQFYNLPWLFGEVYASAPFDAAAATQALYAQVIAPRIEAEHLLRGPHWLTRMATVASPSTMNRDLDLGFNPDLPQVQRNHHARITLACGPWGLDRVRYEMRPDLSWHGPGVGPWGAPQYEDDLSAEPFGFFDLLGTSGPAVPIEVSTAVEADALLDSMTVDEVLMALGLP